MSLPIPIFSIIPFVLLLLLIATGPVLFHHFWERYYGWIASGLALLVMAYYLLIRKDFHHPVEAVADYIQFIALIGALYMASGGILIEVEARSTPWVNLLFLWTGALLSNFVGTTGASMLLIRPFIRLNKGRVAPYHIVFFIFMVSNLGGVLTAVGDPPLLLGFLKGVPFLWTLRHGILPWLTALSALSLIFYYLDQKNTTPSGTSFEGKSKMRISGYFNLCLLGLVAGAVLLDPKMLPWLPTLPYHGHRYSFVRELIMIGIAVVAYRFGNQKNLALNEFSLAPLKEVTFIFIGIFGTMMPAIELIQAWACSPQGTSWISTHFLYWVTGLLSSVLDNAPTYVNFLAAGMSAKGLALENPEDVLHYTSQFAPYLKATSLGAVFFGAMSYIGNGPNFMVKAIAEKQGIKMPSFGKYISHFALPYLSPVLTLVWGIFFGAPAFFA